MPTDSQITKYAGVIHTLSAAEAKTLDERGLPAKLGWQYRRVQLESGGYDKENHTVSMAVSSQTPVERYFGMEILSHKPGALRTDRLKKGIPMLFNHNMDAHLGRSVSYKLRDDGVLEITGRFGTNPLALEKEGDVASGILVDVSIGYRILEADVVEDKNGLRTVTATDWEIYEFSPVTIPADPTVGVGRAAGDDETPIKFHFRKIDDEGEEADDEDDDDGDEAERAASLEASRTTTPEEKRTVMAETAVVEVDLAKVKADRTAALTTLSREYPKEFGADTLARFVALDVDERKAKEFIADQVIASNLRHNVKTVGDSVVGDMSERELKDYSLARSLRYVINQKFPGTFRKDADAKFEREISDEIGKRSAEEGNSPFGGGNLLMPSNLPFSLGRAMQAAQGRGVSPQTQQRVLSAGGNAGAASNFTTTETTAIELLRNRTRCLALGATSMSGLSGIIRMPRQNAASQSSWLAEGAAANSVDMTFDDIMLTPKRLSIWGSYYMELLAQSSLAIEDLLRADQVAVEAESIDLASINGSGTNNVPLGLLLQTGLAAVLTGKTLTAAGTGGVAATYMDIIQFLTLVAKANADGGRLGWMVTPELRGMLMATPKFPGAGVGIPIWAGDPSNDPNGLDVGPLGYRAGVTNQLPKNGTSGSATGLHTAIFGDFSSMLIADWGIRELVVDNITQARTGQYIVTENSLRDTNVRHIEKFAASTTILTN